MKSTRVYGVYKSVVERDQATVFFGMSLSMDVIIDIQALFGKRGEFLPKELAVTTLQDDSFGHWIVETPCDFGELPKSVRASNNRLTCFNHGLEWVDGDTPLEKVYKNLRAMCRFALRVYTRGLQKAQILRDVLGREIFNLEDYEGPSLKNMPGSEIFCIHHGLCKEGEDDRNVKCALNNVCRIKNWLQFELLDAVSPIYTDPIEPPAIQKKETTKEKEEEKKVTAPKPPRTDVKNKDKKKGTESEFIYNDAMDTSLSVELDFSDAATRVDDEFVGLFRSNLEIPPLPSQVQPPTPPPRRDHQRKRPHSEYNIRYNHTFHPIQFEDEQFGGVGLAASHPGTDEGRLSSRPHTESLV